MYAYESPIQIIRKDIEYQYEENILKAVVKEGIVIDKKELLEALKYDRDQYGKGYRQGIEDAVYGCMTNIIPLLDENGVDEDVVRQCIKWFEIAKDVLDDSEGETE